MTTKKLLSEKSFRKGILPQAVEEGDQCLPQRHSDMTAKWIL